MSDEATISLNPAKTSELDFEVTVQGLDDDEPPVVRFVIVGNESNYDHSFRCSRIEDEKHGWNVKLPVLDHISGDTVPFRVEVIVDGYYFEPAQGEIAFVKKPDIKIGGKKKAARPIVTTSFKVKQDGEAVEEAAGGGEVTGQPQITNSLLVPEFEPKQSGPVRPAEDENIDHDKLSDIASGVVPGQGTDDTGMAAVFDPKTTAAAIVARTIGKVQRPEKQGSLFARRAGKTAIPGLEDAETQREQQNKATKVKEILATTK
jgi:hypothetical protein